MKPLWQTDEWESFQKALGHKTVRVSDELMILHPLFFGMSYGYVPRGPSHGNSDFLHDLSSVAKKQRLIFSRLDPEKAFIDILKLRSVASSSVQPETSLFLDLRLSEKELLDQMKRKGRYNIGLAEKKGVEVKRAKVDEERRAYCHHFHKILRKTTERDVFSAHDEHYYQTMLEKLPSSEIFLAWYDGQPISGAICTFSGKNAIYYYGASGNHHREVMAPYLLQWEAIKYAKKMGCDTYDFLGIAPDDAQENHAWRGITEFKRKFGGEVVQYPQPIDIIHRPFWYTVYKVLKFFQSFLRK